MKVSKFQAAGNDFVLINNLKEKIPHHWLPQLAVKICDRHFSVGADGLILTERAEAGADFKMVFLNANGTYAEMCGNGARALARFAYEEGLAGSAMAFESMAGLVKAQRLDENRYQVRLNEATVHEVNVNVAIDGKEYRGDYIELGDPGVPHFVLHLPDWESIPVEELFGLARKLRFAETFPKGANVSFFEILPNGELSAVTYERGVEDFTLACGTGAGAMALSVKTQGLTDNHPVVLNLPGGRLEVLISGKDIFLTGEARRVFDTVIDLQTVLRG